MKVFKNEFSWSRSRVEMFHECRRKYYHHYYGAWGGWDETADERTRRTHVLKKLMNRRRWAAHIVQNCIADILRDVREGGFHKGAEEVVEAAVALMRADFRNSREGGYWRNPKSAGLIEHEYDIPVADSDWRKNAEHVRNCLRGFLASDLFQRTKTLGPEQMPEIGKFDYFELEGRRIFARPDLCVREGEGIALHVFKTGKADEEDVRRQLAGSALFIAAKWNAAEPLLHQLPDCILRRA